jgi:hypothetical protein
MKKAYRFTDWYNEANDFYGSLRECKAKFAAAVKDDPDGRFSIYDISGDFDEGIIFNEKCPEYKGV